MGFPKGVAEKMLLDSFHKYPYKQYTDPSQDTHCGRTILDESSPKKEKSPVADISPVSPRSMPVVDEGGPQVPIGNGGHAERYYWTQTLKEATVYVDIDAPGVRGKDVKCVIKPRELSLVVKGENIIQGEFEDAVKVDESMWTLLSDDTSEGRNQQVIITLDKTRHTWWKHILKGDPEIDTTKVDSTQNISEYDEETQATIRKIMFDQKQKRLGLPTSEESKADEILKKAMYAPGSPFIPSGEPDSSS
eukprot:CAMPEP_0185034018 /NCGR_PEP_ID=MMETSP1103-20130426/23505_1 /TAXON_ID=36769 /ORGANISM="Paraphysomonas bandaiensis, Strain Caron Lab Isolate" /LENGTH=247 /DNA_ID=CAMNT_0027570501 /DNA_START=141 /DNA_END=884 /DNA_ORIENTATION=+